MAPRPRASDAIATIQNPGERLSARTPYRASCARSCSQPSRRASRLASVTSVTLPNSRRAASRASCAPSPAARFSSIRRSRWNDSSSSSAASRARPPTSERRRARTIRRKRERVMADSITRASRAGRRLTTVASRFPVRDRAADGRRASARRTSRAGQTPCLSRPRSPSPGVRAGAARDRAIPVRRRADRRRAPGCVSEMPHPWIGSRASVLRISRSSVPWRRSAGLGMA